MIGTRNRNSLAAHYYRGKPPSGNSRRWTHNVDNTKINTFNAEWGRHKVISEFIGLSYPPRDIAAVSDSTRIGANWLLTGLRIEVNGKNFDKFNRGQIDIYINHLLAQRSAAFGWFRLDADALTSTQSDVIDYTDNRVQSGRAKLFNPKSYNQYSICAHRKLLLGKNNGQNYETLDNDRGCVWYWKPPRPILITKSNGDTDDVNSQEPLIEVLLVGNGLSDTITGFPGATNRNDAVGTNLDVTSMKITVYFKNLNSP